jgi:hypothetical protein
VRAARLSGRSVAEAARTAASAGGALVAGTGALGQVRSRAAAAARRPASAPTRRPGPLPPQPRACARAA